MTERTFAHVCENGGARRRCWLHGLLKVSKRYLLQVAALCNLGLIMHKACSEWGRRGACSQRRTLPAALAYLSHVDDLVHRKGMLERKLARRIGTPPTFPGARRWAAAKAGWKSDDFQRTARRMLGNARHRPKCKRTACPPGEPPRSTPGIRPPNCSSSRTIVVADSPLAARARPATAEGFAEIPRADHAFRYSQGINSSKHWFCAQYGGRILEENGSASDA